MGLLVVNGAVLECSEGLAPGSLLVIRPTVTAGKQPAANVTDTKPIANLVPFGMCNSKSNPAVISATTAAQGVHTPAPCFPKISGQWQAKCQKVKLAGAKALDEKGELMCDWAGKITVTNAGQTAVKVN